MKILRPLIQFLSCDYVAKFNKYVVKLGWHGKPAREYWIKENQLQSLMRSMRAEAPVQFPLYTTKAIVVWCAIEVRDDGSEGFIWASGPDTSWVEQTFGPFKHASDADEEA